ncbi:MAG: F0F1 ATP synthase subunit alpha [Eubacteriales bacterium]|nr:F0F1 ATP synthase subunit alpha [Eubacteriales bacterium]
MIANIFISRREKINKELDEAIEMEEFTPQVPPIEDKEEEMAKTIKANVLAIQEKARLKKEEMLRNAEETRLQLRRELLSDLHSSIVDKVVATSERIFSREPYLSQIRSKEEAMIDTILSHLHLLPGDISYLKAHGVLYVTLTSTFELPTQLVEKVEKYTQKMLDGVSGKQSFWVKVDKSIIGGLKLRIGDTVYDCSIAEQLYQLKHKAEKDMILGTENLEVLIDELELDMEKTKKNVHIYQTGRVLTVSDGICWMDGLADIMYGEVVEFACGERGMVLDIQKEKIGCVIYGKYEHIESGSPVRRVGRIASVCVGEQLLGRVVDVMGHSIDGKGRILTGQKRPIEWGAPAILDRAPVSEPMHTGLKAIDALVPIGKGQRELIVGDRQTGKSALVVDTIINQRSKGVISIYVAIGQKDTTVADIRSKLEQHDAMKNTIIVCAPASASASLQYIAPFSATAMGEYFMYAGKDVLIIYDDLSKHAVAYRELSLLLHRPSGREAYPGDVFYLHSRLLERSAKLSSELGGGSMTALPIIETLAGDISSYIPTNVISITDGQIFLDGEIFNEGQRPAVNVGLSVSRVGSAAQTKLMKQVSASLRMKLAQYRELSGFSQFGTDMDAQTKQVLDSGERMMAILKQARYNPLEDWKQALLIYAVSEGYADNISIDDLEEFETNLYVHFENKATSLKEKLDTGAKMTDDIKVEVNNALKEFVEESLWQA